ncbi:uncharacterized protein DS421_18g612180 [Arachis hypogaea]|nr:uncharacterized protein DS421_18g612180 [Arachis hypogaea]
MNRTGDGGRNRACDGGTEMAPVTVEQSYSTEAGGEPGDSPTGDSVRSSPAAERKGGIELVGVEMNGQLEGDGMNEGGKVCCAVGELGGVRVGRVGGVLLNAKRLRLAFLGKIRKPAGSRFSSTYRLPAGLAVQPIFNFYDLHYLYSLCVGAYWCYLDLPPIVHGPEQQYCFLLAPPMEKATKRRRFNHQQSKTQSRTHTQSGGRLLNPLNLIELTSVQPPSRAAAVFVPSNSHRLVLAHFPSIAQQPVFRTLALTHSPPSPNTPCSAAAVRAVGASASSLVAQALSCSSASSFPLSPSSLASLFEVGVAWRRLAGRRSCLHRSINFVLLLIFWLCCCCCGFWVLVCCGVFCGSAVLIIFLNCGCSLPTLHLLCVDHLSQFSHSHEQEN